MPLLTQDPTVHGSTLKHEQVSVDPQDTSMVTQAGWSIGTQQPVRLLSTVPEGHAPAPGLRQVAALYDKINNTEPELARAVVTGSAQRLNPLVQEVRKTHKPVFPGYRIRVLDGNHLPASEKRLAPLRSFRGAALPGHSLVVYDPDAGLNAAATSGLIRPARLVGVHEEAQGQPAKSDVCDLVREALREAQGKSTATKSHFAPLVSGRAGLFFADRVNTNGSLPERGSKQGSTWKPVRQDTFA